MTILSKIQPVRYRAIWLSDVHLGFKGCKAEYLLDFLHSTHSEYLFLVGDIIDVWSMKKVVHWPQTHSDVVRAILEKAKAGTKVIYVPGNHDEFLREYHGAEFNGVCIRKEHIYITKQGKRFLVTHGDEFDSAVKCSRALAFIGNHAYDLLLLVNQWFNFFRRKFGFPYWSLSNYIKHRVKNAVEYISLFETAVAQEANHRNFDGLICGHIHKANLCYIDGIRYCNTGDWVESCTALVEQKDGEMALLNWIDEIHARAADNSVAVKAA